MAAPGITWRVESNNLGKIQGQMRGQSYDAVRDTMDDVLTDVMRRMHEPGRGRIYVHGGITHQASAPGQAPAAETGHLIASYEVGVAWEGDEAVGVIGSDAEYAAALEYGAPGRNLAPRPALTPAGEQARRKLQPSLLDRFRRIAGVK